MSEHESWVSVPPRSAFPLANLPFGVFSLPNDSRHRIGVAIGSQILDAGALAASERAPFASAFAAPTLNAFLALGPSAWSEARAWLTQRLGEGRHRAAVEPLLVSQAEARMHLPFELADYVDFYASEHRREPGTDSSARAGAAAAELEASARRLSRARGHGDRLRQRDC